MHIFSPKHSKPLKLQQQVGLLYFDGLGTIAQTGILYMGARCPNSIATCKVQQLGGSVPAWCWILADSGRFLSDKKLGGLG